MTTPGLLAADMRGFLARNVGVVAVTLILAVLTLYPLAMLLFGSLYTAPPGMAGSFDLDGYRSLLSAGTGRLLLDTAVLSLVKTVLSLGLAVLLAWIVARTDTPFRGTLEVLLTLPFFMPPILTAMAWGMLANAQVGSLNLIWRELTGLDAPLLNIYSASGVVWHMVQYSMPFLFLIIVDAFRAMDPNLEESSRMSGASRWQTFNRITLSLLLPVLSSAFLLSFIRGLESFESALIFGTPAGVKVLMTAIYEAINHNTDPNYQYATALSFAVLGLMLLLIMGQWRLLGGRSFQTVGGRGFQPRLVQLGRLRWASLAFCIAVFVVMTGLPVAQLVVGSFFRFFGFYSSDMLTLEHYRSVMADPILWRALGNTLLLGVAGAMATMVLASLVAYIVTRTRHRLRRLVDMLAWLPWMMPGMVLGLGMLWAVALLPGPVRLYGTVWSLLMAYVALGTPLAVRIMSGSFTQLSFDLEECSRVHGATFLQTILRILVALAYPAFAVGWTLTFFMIMRELSASVLLYAPGSEVLSVVVLRLWLAGKPEQCTVIALIMLAVILLLRFVQLAVLKRQITAL